MAAGGIAPLVALLSDGGTVAKQCAAAALARLSQGDEQTQEAIGEAGAIASPAALMNAVTNALGKEIDMPATSEKVWRAAGGG